jgi:integrase
MGSLLRTKWTNSAGERVETPTWIAKYKNAIGQTVRVSTGTADRKEAERELKRLEGEAVAGKVRVQGADKVTIADLADALVTEYEVNGRRSVERLRFSLAHLLPALGSLRALHLTAAHVEAYKAQRLEAGAANATVNRELAALKRMLRLALEQGRIQAVPFVKLLEEDNVRTGFFEPHQLAAVLAHLDEDVVPMVRFAAITGWRSGEVKALEWPQIDFAAGEVRLEPGTTKNRKGRTFPFTPELRELLLAQRERTDRVQREQGRIIASVFHRNGKPISDFRGAWAKACELAGVPDRLVHDLRRTAIRAMVRAGVPERVAMQLSGHRTPSVFARYDIVSGGDLRDAAAKLAGQGNRKHHNRLGSS